jgi:hypothetical protein
MSLPWGRGMVNLKEAKSIFPVRGMRIAAGGFMGTG